MAVIGVEIRDRVEFNSGSSWGNFGPYERIDGIVEFGVDPKNQANSRIVDLQYSPVDKNGLVKFSSDFVLLTPSQSKSSRLLVDIVKIDSLLPPRKEYIRNVGDPYLSSIRKRVIGILMPSQIFVKKKSALLNC